MYEYLGNLLDNNDVYTYFSDETIRIEALAESKELLANRIYALNMAIKEKTGIFITHTSAFLRYLPKKEQFESGVKRIVVGQSINKLELELFLQNNGYKVVMLTGDNEITASKIAIRLGISEFYASKDPLQKSQIIKELNAKTPVVMVGDGINDVVALSMASVGICMGSGAQISVERSDVVLLDDNLNSLLKALNLSRLTFKTIKQNLGFTLIYNAFTIPLAMAGFIIPLFAAISMSLSSIIVVLNSTKIKLKG